MGFFSNLFSKKEKEVFPTLNNYNDVMIDMHSHLLFGIDDGAVDIENSLQLIRGLVGLGYKKLVTTPHVMSDTYKNTPEIILGKLEIVRQKLKENNIGVEINAAAEYYCDHEFYNKIGKEDLLTISKERHLLFEVSYLNAPEIFNDTIFALQSNGYKPVLAHPERYPFWFSDFNKFKEIKAKGVLLQMNINSLTGHYGMPTKKIAEKLIEENMISFIGSDCHHEGHINLMRQTLNNPYLSKLISSGMLMNSRLNF
jgi:tyrosine-protein phosphatase YwqE